MVIFPIRSHARNQAGPNGAPDRRAEQLAWRGLPRRWLRRGRAATRPTMRQAFGSLGTPPFRWWFISQTLSASGTMTQGVALSWLLLKLTGSGVDLGLLGTCSLLPFIVMGSWSGALVDRVDRRRLLISTQSLFIGLATLLAVLTATGTIRVWMIYGLALATGVVSAPDNAARQVYVLDLVGRRRLSSAISLNEVVINTSRVLGPAIGAALLVTVGVAACFLANAISYVPSLIVLFTHRGLGLPMSGHERRARRGQVRAGIRYAWGNPAIRVTLFMAAASGMLFNLSVTLPLMATRVFHVGGGGYGLMMAAFGGGAILGALLAASSPGTPAGRSVRVLAAATGVATVATALGTNIGLELAGLAVTGFVSIWFIARANTFVQLRSDPSMRGRVMGIWVMALPGCGVVTSPLIGWVAQTAGAREGFSLAGVALLITAAAGWKFLSDHGETAEMTACPSGAPPVDPHSAISP